MFHKFLIDNAIKIISSFIAVLFAAGGFITKSQMEISYLRDKITEQEIVVKTQQDIIQKDSIQLARHEWFCSDFQNRIIYLERENKK